MLGMGSRKSSLYRGQHQKNPFTAFQLPVDTGYISASRTAVIWKAVSDLRKCLPIYFVLQG